MWPLIFKHGRWNYIRSSNLFNFYVYKAFAYTLIQVVYAGYNGWSSQTVFPDWFLTLFNMIFSAYPIFAYAWQEIDVFPIEMYRKFIPALYHVGQRGLKCNTSSFYYYLFLATFQAGVLYFIPCLCFETNILDQSGENNDIWTLSIAVFTSLLIVIHNKLLLMTKTIDILQVMVYVILSYTSYFGYLYLTDDWTSIVR